MREWLESGWEFINGTGRRGWAFFVLVALDLGDVYGEYIRPELPVEWRGLSVPGWIFWPMVSVGILWAAISTYHDVRKKVGVNQADAEPDLPIREAILEVASTLSEGKSKFNAAQRIRQAAANSGLWIWGRKLSDAGNQAKILTRIDMYYWKANDFEVDKILGGEKGSHICIEDTEDEFISITDAVDYTDLHLNQEQFQRWMKKSRR